MWDVCDALSCIVMHVVTSCDMSHWVFLHRQLDLKCVYTSVGCGSKKYGNKQQSSCIVWSTIRGTKAVTND